MAWQLQARDRQNVNANHAAQMRPSRFLSALAAIAVAIALLMTVLIATQPAGVAPRHDPTPAIQPEPTP